MKKILMSLFALAVVIGLTACKGNTDAVSEIVIPADKAGVTFSNPFLDNSKFDRAVTYYSKNDVDKYKITVWYADQLEPDAARTEQNAVATLSISKEDSYTSKTMILDYEGLYEFKCEAFSGEDLIAEDNQKAALSFANVKFVIFYLVPKIKSQTAEASVTILWQGDNTSEVAHTIRIVNPCLELDTSFDILQNGNISCSPDSELPAIVNVNGRERISKIKMSECEITSMVGAVSENFSFSISISPNTAWKSKNNSDCRILSWTRVYDSNGSVTTDNLDSVFGAEHIKDNLGWILLDNMIRETRGNDGLGYWENRKLSLEEVINRMPSKGVDDAGNIITYGDYVGTICRASDNWERHFDISNTGNYAVGMRVYVYVDERDESFYTGEDNIFAVTHGHCNAENNGYHYDHYLIFEATRIPYLFTE